MTKFISTITVAVALAAGNLFAASDYIIQITEKDGTVREIPATALEKVTFEVATKTIDISSSNSSLSIEDTAAGEKISATRYSLSAEDANKLVQNFNTKKTNKNKKFKKFNKGV